MDESQRALAAAKLANLGAGRPPAAGTAEPAAEADETAVSGTGRLVRPNGDGAPIGAVSQKGCGRIDEGSRRSTQVAAAIKNDPDLALAVERGHVTVADAYQVRDEPAEVEIRDPGREPRVEGGDLHPHIAEASRELIGCDEATRHPRRRGTTRPRTSARYADQSSISWRRRSNRSDRAYAASVWFLTA